MAPNQNRGYRTGSVLVYMVIALPVLAGICSLGVDYGRCQVVKTQLRRAADAAALYGVDGLAGGTAVANAIQAAADNKVDGNPLVLNASDVVIGTWSEQAGFSAGGSSPNAVQVTAYQSKARGSAVPLLFAQILGLASTDLNCVEIAAKTTVGGYGIVGINSVTLSGSAHTDSYDSSVAGYSSSSAESGGSVATNGWVQISGGAAIHGTLYQLSGQSLNSSGGASIASQQPLGAALSYPAASSAAAESSNDNVNIPSQFLKNGGISLSGSQALTLSSGTYYLTSLTLSGNSSLTIQGSVSVYVAGTVNLSGSVVVEGNLPSSFQVTVTSTQDVTLSGSSALYALVYAPQSNVTVSGSGGFFGSVIGSSLTLTGSAGVHFDQGASISSTVALVK